LLKQILQNAKHHFIVVHEQNCGGSIEPFTFVQLLFTSAAMIVTVGCIVLGRKYHGVAERSTILRPSLVL
jgi:hypothetical protein